jgi:hypothetical protein
VQATILDPNLFWIAAAIMLYTVNLSLRAWRCRMILRIFMPIPYRTVAKALLVGYGLNAIMLARLGEFFSRGVL